MGMHVTHLRHEQVLPLHYAIEYVVERNRGRRQSGSTLSWLNRGASVTLAADGAAADGEDPVRSSPNTQHKTRNQYRARTNRFA